MSITAILIDDEQDSLEALKTEIENYCPEVEILDSCLSPKGGIAAIKNGRPDVVFLDIEMPDMNGFELLKHFDEINFDVIFVTAYDQFAVRAFEFNVQDYLLKPVLKSKLIQAVEKIVDRQSQKLDKSNLDALINHISVQIGTGARNIALPTAEGFEFVALDDIQYVQAESSYCWVQLVSGKKYLLTKPLKQLAILLRGPQFFRAHQSYLVNLNFAKKYVRGQGGYIVLSDNTQVPVSRSRKEELTTRLRG